MAVEILRHFVSSTDDLQSFLRSLVQFGLEKGRFQLFEKRDESLTTGVLIAVPALFRSFQPRFETEDLLLLISGIARQLASRSATRRTLASMSLQHLEGVLGNKQFATYLDKIDYDHRKIYEDETEFGLPLVTTG